MRANAIFRQIDYQVNFQLQPEQKMFFLSIYDLWIIPESFMWHESCLLCNHTYSTLSLIVAEVWWYDFNISRTFCVQKSNIVKWEWEWTTFNLIVDHHRHPRHHHYQDSAQSSEVVFVYFRKEFFLRKLSFNSIEEFTDGKKVVISTSCASREEKNKIRTKSLNKKCHLWNE